MNKFPQGIHRITRTLQYRWFTDLYGFVKSWSKPPTSELHRQDYYSCSVNMRRHDTHTIASQYVRLDFHSNQSFNSFLSEVFSLCYFLFFGLPVEFAYLSSYRDRSMLFDVTHSKIPTCNTSFYTYKFLFLEYRNSFVGCINIVQHFSNKS